MPFLAPLTLISHLPKHPIHDPAHILTANDVKPFSLGMPRSGGPPSPPTWPWHPNAMPSNSTTRYIPIKMLQKKGV